MVGETQIAIVLRVQEKKLNTVPATAMENAVKINIYQIMEIVHVLGAGKVLPAIYLHVRKIVVIMESAFLVSAYAK